MKKAVFVILFLLICTTPIRASRLYYWEDFMETPDIDSERFIDLNYLVGYYHDYHNNITPDPHNNPKWIIDLLNFVNDYHHRASVELNINDSTQIFGNLNYIHNLYK